MLPAEAEVGMASIRCTIRAMSADYEYRGLMAASWDLLRGDYSAWPDRPFYRSIIERAGQPALDVGCGTGRLLLDYLAAGIDIDGVDNSPEMLAICQRKASELGLDVAGRLFEQPMERLDLPRRYRAILVPSSSFQLITNAAEARDVMRRFSDHLAPGGVLVMSLMISIPAERPPQREWTAWFKAGQQERAEDGALVRRQMRVMYDYEEQLEHLETRYQVLNDGVVTQEEIHMRSPSVRWYAQDQARQLFRDAGFADVRLTGGFTDAPAAPGDTPFCALGTRP